MKMRWIGRTLFVGSDDVALAGIGNAAHGWWWECYLPDSTAQVEDCDTEEAAKAAAEKVVREWIVSLLGEPVAWRFDTGNGWAVINDSSDPRQFHDNGRPHQPLYALEAHDG